MLGCGYVTLDRHLPALRHVPEIEVTRDARRAGVLAPLLLWHVAHTAGFAWEWARTQAAR